MDKVTAATLKVIIDGQAYLWAHQRQQESELLGGDVSPTQFEKWEAEWKEESANLINTILEEANE